MTFVSKEGQLLKGNMTILYRFYYTIFIQLYYLKRLFYVGNVRLLSMNNHLFKVRNPSKTDPVGKLWFKFRVRLDRSVSVICFLI